MENKNKRVDYIEKKIAILIDSENISSTNIELIVKESIKYGLLTIRRIYGDWTNNQLSSWKRILPIYAIQPIQQFRNTSGKNSTDSAMIIDAMDILYSNFVDGFIIVSSDSDYTKLAVRLRESGKLVVGIGEKKTPQSLINACNEFKFIENLQESYKYFIKESSTEEPDKEVKDAKDELLSILIESYEMIDQESEWKHLSAMAHNLKKLDPGFDPRNYGSTKLSKLIVKYDKYFEMKSVKKAIYVRKK
ncbi:MAG: NYN domain-containing protein [Spirochaetes bacterium]|nr:NYN domain-containing protein [Spirochaetota bacterium]